MSEFLNHYFEINKPVEAVRAVMEIPQGEMHFHLTFGHIYLMKTDAVVIPQLMFELDKRMIIRPDIHEKIDSTIVNLSHNSLNQFGYYQIGDEGGYVIYNRPGGRSLLGDLPLYKNINKLKTENDFIQAAVISALIDTNFNQAEQISIPSYLYSVSEYNVKRSLFNTLEAVYIFCKGIREEDLKIQKIHFVVPEPFSEKRSRDLEDVLYNNLRVLEKKYLDGNG
ncbi:hypothetical protein A3D05_03365 [Candidatus Gottesmanbacteria bacterium RIFCSPHIGHO2_02_FULL_40_24]|uniref:Uncharacterized protein n=1 Tax=Candidatus Gottesmanbacteria bacterium RIFCSPHIGHO2_01_FULL_40_15 TaxID=1798376 RepID=A0A1F5Z0U5_9BACT|nr:MAG: hypothetical protein A2777_02490 [Candidatus Gottesmanbacteria bacterium RIFCSPHIGHO2_01_FULL_40_15]OGG17872.1 MAG: hypothetical protein A3D05_03365 [Candidatus Gottesmanbacteria bacterium RIFCSPHIGHO2_02_FULL_40_24]OGG21740.1 MAG: hypothetical protein A3B48_03515 [Candidatus Gottesmanbacteria bacterium RIFCSPLOWO2_01_FULL_40_10]OGG24713.1 MAG: hypothetical protein A3E42_01545 [Candidatus Gottesmanbacteria bacterium RIFCSPHIGHO2_12_FULL_40_13]